MHIPGNSSIREFEYLIAGHVGFRYALSVCNATIGILGVFHALELANKEIITTPLTWPGALSGLKLLNCKIKFCDVHSDTLTLDPAQLNRQITPNTKAIFSSDFLGYPANLDEINKICKKFKIYHIHDAASSFGTIYKNRFSGVYADITIYSFGSKKMFTTGEGGCILTNNNKIYTKILSQLSHPDIQHVQTGKNNLFALNTKLNPFAATYGINTFKSQLNRIKDIQNKYMSFLSGYQVPFGNQNIVPNGYKIIIKNANLSKLPKKYLYNLYKAPNPVYYINGFGYGKNINCPIAEKAQSTHSILDYLKC